MTWTEHVPYTNPVTPFFERLSPTWDNQRGGRFSLLGWTQYRCNCVIAHHGTDDFPPKACPIHKKTAKQGCTAAPDWRDVVSMYETDEFEPLVRRQAQMIYVTVLNCPRCLAQMKEDTNTVARDHFFCPLCGWTCRHEHRNNSPRS